MVSSPGTRGDIQGLRAFAVAVVLLFHVDVAWAAGGYLGVDIFFVISGFLITRILYEDVFLGPSSLGRFYLRRIRRLLPALVVTTAATLAVGTVLLTSQDQMALGQSSIAAIFSVSNFLFWSQAGYFDEETYLKPLLHTWSLGVEEQFYLVWPALILVAGRFGRRVLIGTLCVAALISLAGAQWLVANHPSAVFFLTPFRVFEFGAGALLYFAPPLNSVWVRNTAYVAGLTALIYSCAVFGPEVPMPGLYSLVPTLGTVFCIAGGLSPVSALLSNRPARIVGDMSYSLYLVHWPIVAFYKYVTDVDLSAAEQAGLILASVAVGYLLHMSVEQPMRRPEFWRRWQVSLAPALAVLIGTIGVAAGAWATTGWAWLMPNVIREATATVQAHMAERLEMNRKMGRAENVNSDIVIIGDSHASDVASGFFQLGLRLRKLSISVDCQPVLGGWPAGTPTKTCEDAMRRLLESKTLRRAKLVLIAPRWRPWAVPHIQATIEAIRARSDAKIMVFGNTVVFKRRVMAILQQYGKRDGADAFAATYEEPWVRPTNEAIRLAAKNAGAEYIDKIEVLCGSKPCPIFVPGTNKLTIWDTAHYTAAGAKLFARALLSKYPAIKMASRGAWHENAAGLAASRTEN